jgi:putative endonuclease
MSFWVYIIQSETSGRFYCGQTQVLERRLVQHNDPSSTLSRTTKRFLGPWRLVWSREVANGSDSVRLERQIKKRGIGRFLQEQGVAVNPA